MRTQPDRLGWGLIRMLLCSGLPLARRVSCAKKEFRVNSSCISLCAVLNGRASLAQVHNFVAACKPQVPMPPPGLARQLLHGFRDEVPDHEPAGAAHPTPEFFLVQGLYEKPRLGINIKE